MIRGRLVTIGALSAVLTIVPVACTDDTTDDDADASTSTTSTTTTEPDATSPSGPAPTSATGPATTISVAEVFTDPNNVRDMASDNEGRIWAVGPGGVTRFDPATGERRTLTVADGLPTHEIYAVAVDGDVIWLGTQFGLVSIEGDTVVEHGPAMPAGGSAETGFDVSPRMYAVAVGPDGAVWAYRAPEVVRYTDGRWETVARLGGTVSFPYPYPQIAVADDGTAWVSGVDLGPAGVSSLVRLVGDSAEPVPGFPGFSEADAVYELALAPNGDLWVATGSQAARHRDGEWTRWTVGVDFPGATAHGLALGDDGLPWVITRELDDTNTDDIREQPVIEHEIRFDGSAWLLEATTTLAGPGGPRPVVVLDERPWTPNGDGVRARIDGEATVVSLGDDFIGTMVSSVAVADDGVVWALTDRTLLRYDGEQWTPTAGWPGSTATAKVVAVSGSEAWALLGTSSRSGGAFFLPDLGPLAHVDGEELEVIDPWDDPEAPFIRDIDLDIDSSVVLATTAGPARLEGGAAVVEPIPSLDPAGIGQIHVAPDATIWASSQGRVLAYDDGWTLRASGETWLDSALAVEPGGVVWTGGFNLLGRFDDTGWQTWTELDSEPIAAVAALALDPDGVMLVGIQGDEFAEETVALRDRRRLWVLEGDTWVARDPTGVALNPITSLAFAADGSLWVGTTHGVVHLPPDWAS